MARSFTRQDFLIKELAVSVGAAGRGGTWMPGPDDETPPSPISPIASVLANLAQIEAVRGAMVEAMHAKQFEEIAAAFVPGSTAGNAAIRTAIQEIGTAVVASAAFAAVGGAVGYPNPDCGGTSYETIPPTLTPIIHVGFDVHRVSELPRLKRQLAQTLKYVEKAAAAQAPHGEEIQHVEVHLQTALKELGAHAVPAGG